MASSDNGAGPSGMEEPVAFRKVRVHKKVHAASSLQGQAAQERDAEMDKRIAELIPGLADLSVSAPSQQALQSAASVRASITSREEARRKEAAELANIFDMSVHNPVDKADPSKPWVQKFRPPPKRVVLSHYQYEMINYQRMLLRKNIWYYRDRMNNPRGPCPLHTLKDAWVQGVIDENTLVWGQGLFDWLPAKNVKLLLPMIRTPEVRFGAWMKRTFSLKPSLNKIREARSDVRVPEHQSKQVERMR